MAGGDVRVRMRLWLPLCSGCYVRWRMDELGGMIIVSARRRQDAMEALLCCPLEAPRPVSLPPFRTIPSFSCLCYFTIEKSLSGAVPEMPPHEP